MPRVSEPQVSLDAAVLRRNAAAWRARAGAQIRAVIKSDGYGWGAARVIAAVDAEVDGYLVADVDEFARARSRTARPIATLADVSPADVAFVLDAGGIPNLSEREAFAAADAWARARSRRPRVRVGVRSAASWSGIDPPDIPALAQALAPLALDVELWTHLTDPSLARAQRAAFERAVAALREQGVAVVATDVASSAPLAAGADGAGARLGAGLFGFRFGAALTGVAGTLRVRAPVVRIVPAEGQLMSYGTARAPRRGWLVVVRCGYGDGFPRVAQPWGEVLAVGMQYAVLHRSAPPEQAEIMLLDETTDLDGLAQAARIGPHELIVRLGQAEAARRLRNMPGSRMSCEG